MEPLFIQGRWLLPEQRDWIGQVMATHRTWGRFRLSVHWAEHWHWRNGAGQLKDMAARTRLRKLEARGWIQLPPRTRGGGGSQPARALGSAAGPTESPPPLKAELGPLRPLAVQPVQSRAERRELTEPTTCAFWCCPGCACGDWLPIFGHMSALHLTWNAQASSYTEPVSRQAVDQRYHERTVDFFRATFDHCSGLGLDP